MGFRGRYKNKRDANEPEIIAAFEAHGFTVEALDTPCDLTVGKWGRTWLIEVKAPKGRMTPTQDAFLKRWRGQIDVIRSVHDVELFARAVAEQRENTVAK